MLLSDTCAERRQTDVSNSSMSRRYAFSLFRVVVERYSLTVMRIVSGMECRKRRFRSSSSLLCMSSVTAKVYLCVNCKSVSINSPPQEPPYVNTSYRAYRHVARTHHQCRFSSALLRLSRRVCSIHSSQNEFSHD